MEDRFTEGPSGRGAAILLSSLQAVFFIASIAVIPYLAPSARIPNPFGADDASRSFYLDHASAIRISDWLQCASAICLGALGAVWPLASRGGPSNTVARGLTVGGGTGAAALLLLGTLVSWALASPNAVDPGGAFHTLQFLPFLLGGPGWAAFFGIFMAGVALSGIGVLPRWMVWAGYLLSATSILSTLVLVTLVAAPLLPISRFLGFVWLILAAGKMGRTRTE